MQSQPIDFHPPAEEAAPVLLPVPASLFAERAARFRRLAEGHSLAPWLNFLGELSLAQQAALHLLAPLTLQAPEQLAQATAHGMPPLDTMRPPALWHEVLRVIVRQVRDSAPEGARSLLYQLEEADTAALERLATQLLEGKPQPEAAGALPFVAAALQVVYTRLASQLPAGHVAASASPDLCPCCGHPPVASVLRLGSAINNLRYLHCSLCNTEWNTPRAVCTACGTEKGVALHELEGSAGTPAGAVRAETCEGCKSYLKIVYQEKDPLVDPVADDLATLSLDLLVDDAGFQRSGPNLFLIGAHGD